VLFRSCASVLNSPIINYTALGRRRTTITMSVAYDADLAEAARVLREAVSGVEGVLATPEPEVLVECFAESGVEFAVRWWHAPDVVTLWRVRSEVAMATKSALEGAGITIPFPQRVVHFMDRHVPREP
jgi:small conductance mechanosensitive channel